MAIRDIVRTNRLLIVALVVAVTGTYMLLGAHASTPTANLESESGTVSSAASVISDSTASNSHAVKFGTGTTSSTDFCSSYPALPSVKPDATNTGVPAGTTLTTSGSITASTAGQVINAKNVTGTIYVNANNVTIKNSNIIGTGYYAVQIGDGVTGTKVLYSTISTTNGGYEGILGSDVTICGNHISGFENPITAGNNIVIQANFIEKLQSNQSGPHYDGIEVYDGNNNKIWGNNIMMTDPSGNWLTETGAINVTGTWSSIDNTEINGNWLGGGSYTLNLDDSQGYAVTNLKVTNNVFYGSAPKGHAGYGVDRDPSIPTVWSGNTWSDTGQTISG